MADERRMLSRFGVWLMAALCPPTEIADKKAIGYMMYNVFQWFSTTALLPNDGLGALLEQLKTDVSAIFPVFQHFHRFFPIKTPKILTLLEY